MELYLSLTWLYCTLCLPAVKLVGAQHSRISHENHNSIVVSGNKLVQEGNTYSSVHLFPSENDRRTRGTDSLWDQSNRGQSNLLPQERGVAGGGRVMGPIRWGRLGRRSISSDHDRATGAPSNGPYHPTSFGLLNRSANRWGAHRKWKRG